MKTSKHENIVNKNTQDIFLRNAILALLNLMNREIIIDLIRGGEVEKHEIPFFYNQGGNQGFMQDFFVDLPDDCKYPEFAEGNYDIIPRGIITLTSFQIKSGDITNQFVRGTFTQEERDENNEKRMKAYSSMLYSLPLDLSFDLKIKVDNLNKTFKIMEKIMDFYYKNRVVYFQYRGVRIPAQIKFPESVTQDKKYTFNYNDNTDVTISFQLSMETYYPSFNEETTRFKGNTIQQFGIKQKGEGSGTTIRNYWVDRDGQTEPGPAFE